MGVIAAAGELVTDSVTNDLPKDVPPCGFVLFRTKEKYPKPVRSADAP